MGKFRNRVSPGNKDFQDSEEEKDPAFGASEIRLQKRFQRVRERSWFGDSPKGGVRRWTEEVSIEVKIKYAVCLERQKAQALHICARTHTDTKECAVRGKKSVKGKTEL